LTSAAVGLLDRLPGQHAKILGPCPRSSVDPRCPVPFGSLTFTCVNTLPSVKEEERFLSSKCEPLPLAQTLFDIIRHGARI